jgi:hypothetical protein
VATAKFAAWVLGAAAKAKEARVDGHRVFLRGILRPGEAWPQLDVFFQRIFLKKIFLS